jgi:hypothetical protein
MPFLKNADVMYLLYICNQSSGLNVKILKRYLTASNRFYPTINVGDINNL